MSENNIPTRNRKNNIAWKSNTEKIFKKWCDHATCYSWMHDRSYKKYNCHYTWFTVPVIILSTITGTANFAHERYEEYAGVITAIIGTMNILAAIITTVGQFCKVSSKVEGHRIATIYWDKFGRNIRVELAKDREDRLEAGDFMKTCKEEYNRLIEISPDIPRDVIGTFKKLAIKSKVMDIDESMDMNSGNCICCDECCFCDNILPNCCFGKCKNQYNIEQANSNIKPNEQIELPEICGNFKPTDISNEQKIETIFGRGQYGMFNIEEIIIDDNTDDIE